MVLGFRFVLKKCINTQLLTGSIESKKHASICTKNVKEETA